MTPETLKARRTALGLSQAQLGAELWDNPQSGRVTVVKLETGAWKITKRTAAWLDAELSRLERERAAV